MAYPTGMLSLVLEDIDRRAIHIRQTAINVRAECAAGNVPSSRILNLFVFLKQERSAIVTASGTPGIVQFARDQKNSGTLDVVVEFNAMIAAIDGTTDWIDANFPKDGSGFLLAQTLTGSGPLDRTFTPAQTAGLRTQLDAVVASIN